VGPGGTEIALWATVRTLILTLALLSTGCLFSSQGGIVFPTQSEVGVVTMTDGENAETGVRYKTAVSWASVSPNAKTPVDVGIGYQVDQFGDAEPGSSTMVHGSGKSIERSAEPLVFHGPVIEISKKVGGNENRRQWIGARFEMPTREVNSKQYYGIGASIRASIELFVTTKEDNAIGALGIGSYVESGIRKVPGGENAFVMSTGLSLRLPLAVVN
jgi:hypothetical protein